MLVLFGEARADIFGGPDRTLDSFDFQWKVRSGSQARKARVVRVLGRDAQTRPTKALQDIQTAIADNPTHAENYWLAHELIQRGWLRYSPSKFWADQAIQYGEQFVQLAPLDPRGPSVLFGIAVEHTKLAEKKDGSLDRKRLLASLSAYKRALASGSLAAPELKELVLGNMGESYLMLHQYDQSIATYNQAIRAGGGFSVYLGKAVALHRNGQRAEALRVIRTRGSRFEIERFRKKVEEGDYFFVPKPEKNYFIGMAYSHLAPKEAAEYYKKYVRDSPPSKIRMLAQKEISLLERASR